MPSNEELEGLSARVAALEAAGKPKEHREDGAGGASPGKPEPIKPGKEPPPDTESEEAKQTRKEAPKRENPDEGGE